MSSSVPLWLICFLIPFAFALSYPILVLVCVPKDAPPKRYIQNNFSISIFLFSSFPIAVAVFALSITPEAVRPWFAEGWWPYVSAAALIVTILIVTAIVLQDFMSRPMAPYVLKMQEAKRACRLERELRIAFANSVHDQEIEVKKQKYKKLTHIKSFKDLVKRGGPIAYIHIALTWMGVMFATLYFWYLVVAADYRLHNLPLKPGSQDNLVLVLILLATFLPLRLQTEWYQSYFHEEHWLRKYPAFSVGVVLAVAMLLLLTLLIHPTFAISFFSTFYAVLLGVLGLLGKLKPDWLRTVAHFIDAMTFIEFLALYIVFLIVTSIVTVAAVGFSY